MADCASLPGLGCDTSRTASSADRAYGSGLARLGALTPSTGLEGSDACSDNQRKNPRHEERLRAMERAFKPCPCSCAANLRMWKCDSDVIAVLPGSASTKAASSARSRR